jgi:hypothetical protein
MTVQPAALWPSPEVVHKDNLVPESRIELTGIRLLAGWRTLGPARVVRTGSLRT